MKKYKDFSNIDFTSKIIEARNNIKDSDIKINRQDIQKQLDKLKSIANKFEDHKLKELTFNVINSIEKCNDLKTQIVVLDIWRELMKQHSLNISNLNSNDEDQKYEN